MPDPNRQPIIHKANARPSPPTVSVILLDWSCRESLHALQWLAHQTVPRETYELIWIELYARVLPEALDKADTVITCKQTGIYHKHVGYNVGTLHARGEIITVCDSDAVFPPDFVESILQAFTPPHAPVLMHYEYRTRESYPANLREINQLHQFKWAELWPNVGACMSVRKADAIRFGGFDEHPSFRGYLCGPYDLGWRLINAGRPEVWHPPSVALWHFAHPDPPASFGQSFSWKRWREIAHPHVEFHALTAVEAFATGRLLPLKENPEIHKLRMADRQIGSPLEKRFATMTDAHGFSKRRRFIYHLEFVLLVGPITRAGRLLWKRLLVWLKKILGPTRYEQLKTHRDTLKSKLNRVA
jgi:hypothetical protein